MLQRRGFAPVRRYLTESSALGTFSDADLDRLAADWARLGVMTAMLSYYRALRRKSRREPTRVAPRTLVLWGGQDRFLSRAMFDASLATCVNGTGLWIEEATHWLHLERPECVAEAILRCFRGTDVS